MAISKPGGGSFHNNNFRPGRGRRAPYPPVPQKNRKNDRIRALEVRVIGPDGKQIGVIPTREAIELAKQHGLDLVEVSPTARPPVCRILDFGKFMYEQSKKGKDAAKAPTVKLKEIKFRINIDKHDYETKVRHAEEFLNKNNKVKVTLSMRGREMERQHLGFEVVKRAILDLAGMGTHDGDPKLAGRNIIVMITPLAAARRKPKFMDLSAPMQEEALNAVDEADEDDIVDHDESADGVQEEPDSIFDIPLNIPASAGEEDLDEDDDICGDDEEETTDESKN